jgi:trk system potassium uptake protein TrkH
MEAIDMHHNHKKKSFSPTRRIAFSFFMVILVGSILLTLPISNQKLDTVYLDHLFVATSATCVTGLVPLVVQEQYTLFGQVIILILIQIGGLGFLTLMGMMFVSLKKKMSYTNKIVMQEALNQNSGQGLSLYIKRVIKYTFFFEMLGAVCLMFVFVPEFGIAKGLYYSIFHSISAFCNAGFDVLGSQSLMMYQSHVWLNLVITGLIIAGGLGFVTWIDIRLSYRKYREKFSVFRLKKFINSLSLHTKIVLLMTGGLLLLGTLVILILEFSNPDTLGTLSFPEKVLVSFFQSTTLRTAGFATIDIAKLCNPTKLVMSVIMFIGGSPAGTAGGIKTVTFLIVLLTIRSLIQGTDEVRIFNRSISQQTVKRSLIIIIVSFLIALSGLLALTITEQKPFIDLVFEIFSAFATVGLTAGLTPLLTNLGKMTIIIMMYIGRIGPITMVLMFAKKYNQMKGKEIHYPVDDVLIG